MTWKIQSDPELIGFTFNPCDTCMTNRNVSDKQHNTRFHADDLMSSHMDKKVNDKFSMWLNKQCREHAEVKATRGCMHDHLGITFGFVG